MQVKGTAVKPTMEFVKNRFPEKYDDWFNKLPESSQKIFRDKINVALWYPATEAFLIPTKVIGELFYDNIEDAAFELGRYSAEIGLTGIYKIFIRIATPRFILSRATNIFSSYYNPAFVKLNIQNEKLFHFYVYKFKKEDKPIAYRIAGWINKALELTNCKDLTSEVEEIKENNETVFKIISSWA